MSAKWQIPHHFSPDVFSQDIATITIPLDGISAKNVCCLACDNVHKLTVVDAGGLKTLKDNKLVPLFGQELITGLYFRDDIRLIWTKNQLFHLNPGGARTHIASVPTGEILSAVQLSGKKPILLTRDSLYEGEELIAHLPHDTVGTTLAATHSGDYFVGAESGLFQLEGKKLNAIATPGGVHKLAASSMDNLYAIVAGRLYLYCTGTWLPMDTALPIPIAAPNTLAVGSDGTVWIGNGEGAARLWNGKWRYFANERWMLDNKIHALVSDGEGGGWIATDTGLTHIESQPMTMKKKAQHFQEITETRHDRHGLITSINLVRKGDLTSIIKNADDNDGLWTSLYVAAECFRYAVTREQEARDKAHRSMFAMLDLVKVTGIPGFPARSLIYPDEHVNQSDPGPNWYPSPTMPGVMYKNDTSSDEIDGHFLAWYTYSSLVANAAEKAEIVNTCRQVMNHILDHNFTLVGPTGKATTWGVWAPSFINDDPNWSGERGLNPLEILSHLSVAIHLCPEEARFKEAYRELIAKYHYALNTIMQRIEPPQGESNFSDDELAACAYYPLLSLETDPGLRAIYLLSLERTQTIVKEQRSAFYNILYAALSGSMDDIGPAITWLQESPWDLREWQMINHYRADIAFRPGTNRQGEGETTRALSPAETAVLRWNHDPFSVDTGGNAFGELDGSYWLLPYWMGRYYNLLGDN